MTAENLLAKLEEFWRDDEATIEELYYALCDYMDNTAEYREDKKEYLYQGMIKIICSGKMKEPYFILSSILATTEKVNIFEELLRLGIEDSEISKENRHFIFYQLVCYRFLHPSVNKYELNILMDELYDKVFEEYLLDFGEMPDRIPKTERDEDFVIVLTTQVLSMAHGPTKTLLDRCYILEKVLNKKIYIINTAEMMSSYGYLPWFDAKTANYDERMLNSEFLEYKDTRFAYFQCEKDMPQISVIREIIKLINETKPWYVVAIDGYSITADLCSQIVPVLTVTLGPSERAVCHTTFQMTGKKIDERDIEWLSKHNLSKDHIIEGLFTSAFREKTHTYRREDIGLPEKGVICIVVGGRLDREIGTDFLDLLRKLAEKGIYTVLMGGYNNYEEACRRYPCLSEFMINMGPVEDVLAVCECCDIYLNPIRLGGGTSAAEALYMGLPALSTDYGDVAVGVGDEFIVKDYDEMFERVIQLADDKAYYASQSEKAHKRAEKLTDSAGEFSRIIREMESRKNFY